MYQKKGDKRMRNNKCFIHKGTLFVPKANGNELNIVQELAEQMRGTINIYDPSKAYQCEVDTAEDFFIGDDNEKKFDNCDIISITFSRTDDAYSRYFTLSFKRSEHSMLSDYYVFDAYEIYSCEEPGMLEWLSNEISKQFDINCQVFSDEIARLLKEETVKEMFPNVHFSCEGNLLLLDKTNTGKGVEYFMSAVLSSINATTPGWILPKNCIKFGEVWDEFDGLEITIYNPVTRDKACISFFEEYKKSPYHETIAYSYCTTYGPIGKDIDELMKRMGIERTKFISDSYEDEDVDMTTADKTFNTEDD